jgi:hypothetical protein
VGFAGYPGMDHLLKDDGKVLDEDIISIDDDSAGEFDVRKVIWLNWALLGYSAAAAWQNLSDKVIKQSRGAQAMQRLIEAALEESVVYAHQKDYYLREFLQISDPNRSEEGKVELTFKAR